MKSLQREFRLRLGADAGYGSVVLKILGRGFWLIGTIVLEPFGRANLKRNLTIGQFYKDSDGRRLHFYAVRLPEPFK